MIAWRHGEKEEWVEVSMRGRSTPEDPGSPDGVRFFILDGLCWKPAKAN
jgi:hypothetical protein